MFWLISRNEAKGEMHRENTDMWRWWGQHTFMIIKPSGNARNGKFSLKENVIVPLTLCRREP